MGYDKPIATVFGSKRTAQVPKFEVWKLNQDVIGSVTVNTPPPNSALVKPKNFPMPKGKMSLILTPLTEQSLVNKTIGYEIITRLSNDFAGKKRARCQAESDDSVVEGAIQSADGEMKVGDANEGANEVEKEEKTE